MSVCLSVCLSTPTWAIWGLQGDLGSTLDGLGSTLKTLRRTFGALCNTLGPPRSTLVHFGAIQMTLGPQVYFGGPHKHCWGPSVSFWGSSGALRISWEQLWGPREHFGSWGGSSVIRSYKLILSPQSIKNLKTSWTCAVTSSVQAGVFISQARFISILFKKQTIHNNRHLYFQHW